MELRETYQSQELRLIEQHNEQKERMIYSVLGIEANKHHSKEVQVDDMPKVGSINDTGVQFREELMKKYSDVSNKYNEILEVTTASHQGIGNLMAEFSDFKEAIGYRLNRLEEFNLTPSQKNEFKEKTAE